MPEFTILSNDEIGSELRGLPGWKVSDGKLCCDFVFKDFLTALAFINLVGAEAEAMQHHPEIFNVYNRVRISFVTHDAGNQITDLDVKMARLAALSAGKLTSPAK